MAFYYDKDGYRVEMPSTASPTTSTPQYYYDKDGYRVPMSSAKTSSTTMPEFYYDQNGYRVEIPKTSDVEGLYNKYNELVNGYSQRYSQTGYRADYADWKTNTNNSTSEMSALSAKIRKNLETYRKVYGDEYADSVLELINGIDSGLISLNDAAEKEYAIFSRFATEEDYNNAVAAYEEEQRLLNYDIAATEAQIKTLNDNLARVNELYNERAYWMQARNKEKVAEVEKELVELSLATDKPAEQAMQNIVERYTREIDRLQKEIDLAKSTKEVINWNSISDPNSELYDPDFERYVAIGADTKNKPKKVYYDNSSQEYVSANDKGIQNPAAFVRNGGRIGNTDSNYDFKLSDDAKRYLAMSEEEFEMYNYFLGKYGKKRAEEYIDWLEKSAYSLTARVASKEFEEILQGNRALEYFYGVAAGLDQFGTGIRNLFSNKDYYRPSVTQYKSSYVREDLKNSGPQVAGVSLGQIAYDVTTTSSAMMPSVLTSTLVSTVNPVAGRVVGGVLMGASASGNAYAEMVNLGYSKGQARTYSLFVGVSETTLEYFLNGVGKGAGKLIEPFADSIGKIMGRFAIKHGDEIGRFIARSGSEALEEMLQEALDPVFRSIATGDIHDAATLEEILYSGLLGAVSAAGINSVGVAYNKVAQAVDGAKANALTKNEKIVLEGVVEKRIAELEVNGEKLTSAQKKEIEKQVRQELDDGDISVSEIEEVLGDKWEQNGEDDRRIVSSYAQELEKTRAFSADVSNYTEKQKAIIQSAIDSGVLNNTNRTHKFVDFVAKVAEKMGVEVDFVNNEALKKSGFAVEGKDVAGYLNGNKMVLNVDSSKALNTVVGHEVMHILQDAGLDGKVKEFVKQYAEMKGEWNSRLESTTELYNGISEDAEGELVCDLIGDYLFTDSKFIEMLAAEHQSIFQRLWNDIKRLCKLATAGSKEAKALAKVEKAFADAYRKASKIVSKTKFNLNETVEETKDLLALHNITSNQLKGALERGSLIMPSLALTNKSFSDFGEISLIFKKSSVDPTVNKKNKLYGADAWTAAEPNLKKNPIFNEGKTSEIVDKIKSDIGKEHVAELFDVTYEQFKTAIKNADGDIFGPYIHNLGMQTAYAMEKGIITDIPTRVDGTVDVEKLKELLDAELDTDNGWRKYKRWLNRISDSIITSYDVASNEELLQNMKKQPETAKPFKLSEDGSLVVPAVEYTSIDEVRRNKGRLSENASEATKAVGGEFLTLAKRIGDNSHIGTKNIVTAINKAFADRYSVKNIIKAFADNGITLSQKNASELQNLYKKAVELPTQYFEAKPGREVDFEEASVFVIPNDLDANLKQQLLDKGYDIAEYDPSVEGDRQNVVNSFEEYKFSLSAKAQKNTATKSDGVRYSLNQKIGKEEISNNILNVVNMESVANLDGTEFAKGETDLISQVESYFASLNNIVETKYGEVKLTRNGVKSSLGHGMGRNKAIAFKAVPDVINKGEIIDYQQNWKNRGYDTVVFAAPISIRDTPYFMAVIVNVEKTENSYYLHEVALQKKESNTSFKTGTVKNGTSSDALPSIHSLLQLLQDVNNNSMQNGRKNSLTSENQNAAGDYNVYGRDVKLSKEGDVASETSAKRAATKEDLQAGFDFIINGMQDPASYESAEEERREAFDAITDADEVGENRGVYEDGTSKESVKVINDRDLSYVTNILKDTLHLNSRQVGEVKKIIREYSTQENPNKDDLYRKIEEQFGTVEFSEKIEEIATVKSELRGRKIKVSEAIKNDIADYDAFRKSHYRKLTLSDEGVPVDSLYMELSNNYGSLFPEDIINPSDQLQRIAEVVDMDSYNRGEYEYDADVIQKAVDVIDAGVKRYAKEAKSDIPLTVEQQVADRREDINTYIESDRRERDRRFASYTQDIDNLTAEYEALEDYNSKEAIALQYRIQELKKQRSIDDERFAEKLERHQKSLARVEDGTYATAKRRQSKQEELFTWAKNLLGDTSTWKDKKFGFQYKTNTEKRNLQDVVRDKNGKLDLERANAIYDATLGTYNHNEALLNKESARIKKQFVDMKINSVESEYIQMLGEFRHNPDTTLEEQDVMNFYENNYEKIDEQKVEKAIELAREVYDDLFERVNEVLREQGMKEIPYRKGYFPHFVEEKQGVLNKLFNWKKKNNDIPTDIAGLTEQFNPQRSWQSFNKKREGDATTYNFLEGLDRYVQGSLDWIYHIDDIQKRRAIENYIRYTHSEKGVQERIDEIERSDKYNADEAEKQREIVYNEAGNPLGRFLIDFRTRTNTLAGKKSTYDRSMEEMINRDVYTTVQNLQQRNAANMVVGVVSSAFTNFIPITQSWAEVSPVRSAVESLNVIKSTIKDDGMIEKSDFLTNRLRAAEKLNQSKWDKIIDKAGIVMEGIDFFASQVIWRSKYNQNLDEGMNEADAIRNADQFAEGVMAGRSRGNMPTAFDSKNILWKTFTAFQLEVNNQYGYMFKDVPRDMKNKGIARIALGYTMMFAGAHVFNALFRTLTGRDSALDPLGIIKDLLKDLGYAGDEDDKEEKWTGAVWNLVENLIQEAPFISGVAGGGRIPISTSLPYGSLGDFVEEGLLKDLAGGEDVGKFLKELGKSSFYTALPVMGGQIKKSLEGGLMYVTNDKKPIAGSYTDSGELRFPVESDPLSVAQAILFGQYSSSTAREYFDEGRSPLSDKQLEEFVAMGEEMTIQEYWDYLDEISAINKAREKDKTLDAIKMKVEYINSLDVSLPKKNILVNNILNRKNPVDLQGFSELSGFAEWDFSMKNPEKYQFFKDNGVAYQLYASSEDIKEVYDSDYQWYKSNPEKVVVASAVADTVVEYREIMRGLNDVKGEVYEKTGKTVNGSLKENRLEYINNLDISYGAKLILYKDLYPSDNDFNMEILEYLTEREDISYDDMFVILDELGFKVNAKTGKITW